MLPPLFHESREFSLYIHVPFCAQKCGYCDFYSRASLSGVDDFINALRAEVALYIHHYPDLPDHLLSSIFIGGGTPSILSEKQWSALAEIITDNFILSDDYEWTIECNPESFTSAKARLWLDSGVNRLSMGVQSLDPDILKLAGRIHSAETVENVLQSEIVQHFNSVSCDVIYGLPGQSVEDVETTLHHLLSYPVISHISAYELTIAAGTAFASLPENSFPDDDRLADYEETVLKILSKAGFSRYEVSNYARVGAECRHNLAYWHMKPYLGLGPSAHSFDGSYRFSVTGSLQEYLEKTAGGELPWDSCEKITREMYRDEYLFLAFRTAEGISIKRYESLYGEPLYQGERRAVLLDLEKRGTLIRDDDRLYLSSEGLNLADGVALQLC